MSRTRKTRQVKILWMYWDKGIENITDPYNKMCFEGWKLLNPDWDIRILNEKTVPNYIDNFNDFKGCIVQHQADLLRVKLLEKYGGVWADASTLPMKPLTGNITHMDKGTGVFFYRYIPAFDNTVPRHDEYPTTPSLLKSHLRILGLSALSQYPQF